MNRIYRFLPVFHWLILLLEGASHPGTAVLGKIPGSDTYRDVRRHPEASITPGLLIFRFDAELVFPSSRFFLREALRQVKISKHRFRSS